MKAKWIVLAVVIVAAVAAALYFPQFGVRGWLSGEPQYQGQPVSAWRRGLASDDPAVQADTIRQLSTGGSAAVPVLMALLEQSKSGDWVAAEVRWRAADLLGQIGTEARQAIPALLATAKDEDIHVSKVAITALGTVAPAASAGEVVPAMKDQLPRGGPVAVAAARTLSRFGPAAEPAIPALLQAMHDIDPEVRWNAIRTLGKIGPLAKRTVPELIAATKDSDSLVREHAAESLGDIGPEAREAVPALIALLDDPVARVRRDAVRSLGQIGVAAAPGLAKIKALTTDPDANVRQAAERAVRIVTDLSAKKTP